MRVGIISNLDEQCGNAQYARELHKELQKHFADVKLSDQPEDAEVVIVNWCPSVVGYTPEVGQHWKNEGRKVIVIHQQSYGDSSPEIPFLMSCHRVVTHEPTNWGSDYIPHGIPVVEGIHEQAQELTIGMAGFYFRTMKGFNVVQDLIIKTDAQANLICAPHPMGKEHLVEDMPTYRRLVRGRIIDAFLPVKAVVQLLGWSTVNVFWFEEQSDYDLTGQSGSVGMGLATGRPVIISNSRKFRVLKELYGDEVYVARDREELYNIVKQLGDNPRVPKRILKDMSWETTGRQYAELIKSL